MRRLFLLLLSTMPACTAAAKPEAKDEPRQATAAGDRAQWVDEVTNNYAGVAAGVAINRKCRILPPRESAKLESDLELFTAALASEIHPQYMVLVRETSEQVAEDVPYTFCGAEAKEAVLEAQELVAWWLAELGRHRE